MTETEWLTSTDPAAMLRLFDYQIRPVSSGHMGEPSRFRVSDRKLRLFALACHPDNSHWANWNELLETMPETVKIGNYFSIDEAARFSVGEKVGQQEMRLRHDEKCQRADLLRHIIGNPWQPRCNNRMVWITPLDLARTLYAGDQTAAVPLHDALIETGAPDELVRHFMEPCPYCKDAAFDTGDHGGPLGSRTITAKWLNSKCACKGTRLKYDTHPKGCAFLDLLLGKE